jgi:hypothetical protein
LVGGSRQGVILSFRFLVKRLQDAMYFHATAGWLRYRSPVYPQGVLAYFAGRKRADVNICLGLLGPVCERHYVVQNQNHYPDFHKNLSR